MRGLGQRQTAEDAVTGTDTRRIHIITAGSLGTAAAGWLLLLSQTRWPALRADLASILVFTGLSTVMGLLGFQVARNAMHNMSGIVDLGAVLAFGPIAGAWVAAVSGLAGPALLALRDRHFSWRCLVEKPLFSSGLKVLIALLCGTVYVRQGGMIAPITLTWQALPPLLLSVVFWFILDHLALGIRSLLSNGWSAVFQFWRETLLRSVLVELLPLSLSIVLAVSYAVMDEPAFALLAVALVAATAALSRWGLVSARLEEQVAQLGILNEFWQAMVEAQLDAEELCELLYQYCRRVVDAPIFVLELVESDQGLLDVLIHVEHGVRQPRRTVPTTEAIHWMDERRKPLCSEDAMRDALLFALPAAGEFSRSLLVVPLLAGRELIGMFSAQGFETDALGQEGLNVLSAMANQAATAITNARVYEAAQRRAKQLAAVSQVGQRVAAILELDKLFAEVVQLIAETFEYDHVGIFTIDRDSGEVTFRASTDPAIQEHGLDVSKGAGIIGWVAQFGEPVLANDVTKEPRFDFEDLLASTRAELAVPLKVEERIVGVLDVQSNEPDAFGRDDLFVLQTLADQVAIAVEDARLYTDRQEEAWSSTALLQFSQAVSAENNLDEILQTAVRLTPMLLGVSRCSMLLWEEKAQEFVAAKGYTEDPQLRPLFESVHFRPGDLPLLDQLRADHTPLVVAGSSGAVPSQLAQEYRIGNMLALPLCAQGEFHGAMLVDYADPHVRVSTRKQAILAGLADQVAMAIANARLHIAQREEAWVSTALLQVAQTLASSVDLEESISGIARLIPLLVGVDYSLVFIWDGQAEQFIPVASHGFSKAAADSFSAMRLKPDEMPALGDVMQRRAHVVVEDAAGDGAMPDSVVRTLGVQAYAAAPLTSKREVLGVLVAGYQEKGQRFSDRNISILEGVAYQTAVAIDNARLYEATLEQERTAQELRLAREIQVSFLPERCPSLRGWEICADWRAAREVGGDFYDFIPLDSEHLGLVIADVSDKGMPAALFMSLCRTLLRVSAGETLSPAEALQRANELLVAESRSGMFVTVFYGILNWRQGRLAYANAGHNSPILWRQAQPQVVALAAGGIVLGVLGDIELEERDISIEPGDILLLYTDGVTEPINAQEDEFGGERLVEAIAQNSERPCAEIVQAIHDAVSGFVGDQPQFDDYTLVALKRQA